jgi:uncharacterized protein (DUF433 family)
MPCTRGTVRRTPLPKPQVSAKEILNHMRAGMDDATIMKKYRLSDKGLRSLFKKMLAAGLLDEADLKERRPQKSINLNDIAEDVQSGLGDTTLRDKYGISRRDLETIFGKLVDAGKLDVAEFYERVSLLDSPSPAQSPLPTPVPVTKPSQPKREKETRAERELRQFLRAAQDGNKEIVSSFIARGANVNAADEFGDTALLVASDTGHANVVALLLEKGADVNVKDCDGKTPLHLASKRGHEAVRRLLLDHGA